MREYNYNHGERLSLPQIGNCNIAEPTRTQTLFLFDSHSLESAWSRLAASFSVSLGSCSETSDGTDSRKVMPSFRVIVNQPDLGPWNRLLSSPYAMFCFKSNDVTGTRPWSISLRQPSTLFVWPHPRETKVVAADYCLRPQFENREVMVG